MSERKVTEGQDQLLDFHWPGPPYSAGLEKPRPYLIVLVAGGVAYWNGRSWYSLSKASWPGAEIQWEVEYWLPLDSIGSQKF